MLGSEKRKLALGIFFFIISIFNAGFYLTCDVGLYYVLFIVAKHFSGEKGQMPSKCLSDMFQNLHFHGRMIHF